MPTGDRPPGSQGMCVGRVPSVDLFAKGSISSERMATAAAFSSHVRRESPEIGQRGQDERREEAATKHLLATPPQVVIATLADVYPAPSPRSKAS